MSDNLRNSLLRSVIDQSNSHEAAAGESDSEDELINVISAPGTPSRSRAPSRPGSPTRRAARPIPGPLHLRKAVPSDPLKAFPTDLSQKIFSRLNIRDLAKCARINKKWNQSQTINYVWFQLYRQDNFRDESLPPGKWTKRESKQNWRVVYLQSIANREPPAMYSTGYSSRGSGMGSGYQTPREIKEEKWRAESEAGKPPKAEMREMYQQLGGRKSKTKAKLGGSSGIRDKAGFGYDDD